MNEFCDKCATQNCTACESGKGTSSERLKKDISSKLANFLLSDKHEPEQVVIYVHYAESTAKLTLSLGGVIDILHSAER